MAKTIAFPLYQKKIRGKGWGAFCTRRIPKGIVFNITSLLPLSGREAQLMSGSSLEPYWYAFGSRGRAIALGLGSIMNHCNEPNCSYHFSRVKRTLSFFALRDISAHEELTHDYGWSKSSYAAYGVVPKPPLAKSRRQKK
jgi:SET domain-containing protein